MLKYNRSKIPKNTRRINHFDLQLLWLMERYLSPEKPVEKVLRHIIKRKLMPDSSFYKARKSLFQRGILSHEDNKEVVNG